MTFVERLKDLREEKGYTQKDMAEKIGVKTVTYIKYEHGENEPKYATLYALADIFDVSLDYLTGRSDEKDVHTYRFNKSLEHFQRDLDYAFRRNPEYKSAILELVSKYLGSVHGALMLDWIDLLYAKVKFVSGLDEIYDFVCEAYEKQDHTGKDISQELSELSVKIFSFQKEVDSFLQLFVSKEYCTARAEKDLPPTFEKEILSFKSVND